MILNFVRRCAALLLALTAVSGGAGFSVLDAIAFHRGPASAFQHAMDDASAPAAHASSCTLGAQLPAWAPAPAIAEVPRFGASVQTALPSLAPTACDAAPAARPRSRAPPRA